MMEHKPVTQLPVLTTQQSSYYPPHIFVSIGEKCFENIVLKVVFIPSKKENIFCILIL